MKISSFDLCERLKKDIAVKTTTKDQAKELVRLIKKHGLGFSWAIVWDDIKRGTIFAVRESVLVADRDAAKFNDREIVEFKKLKITEVE